MEAAYLEGVEQVWVAAQAHVLDLQLLRWILPGIDHVIAGDLRGRMQSFTGLWSLQSIKESRAASCMSSTSLPWKLGQAYLELWSAVLAVHVPDSLPGHPSHCRLLQMWPYTQQHAGQVRGRHLDCTGRCETHR